MVEEQLPTYDYNRVVFTEEMRKTYKILVPQMSPLHFSLLDPVLKNEGYNFEMLPAPTRDDIEVGLKYINNDACYPAIIVVGQLMSALLSGKYDIDKTAVIISQTGGGCRATNYIGYLRKALIDAGMKQVPILSLNASDMERQPGFKLTKGFLHRMIQAVVYADALMQCVLATRPYKKLTQALQMHYVITGLKNYVKTLHLPAFVSIISTSKKSFMTLITCRSIKMYKNLALAS